MIWDTLSWYVPSYVLGGQGMRIAVSDEDVDEYIGIINQIAQEHPILVDKYLMEKRSRWTLSATEKIS